VGSRWGRSRRSDVAVTAADVNVWVGGRAGYCEWPLTCGSPSGICGTCGQSDVVCIEADRGCGGGWLQTSVHPQPYSASDVAAHGAGRGRGVVPHSLGLSVARLPGFLVVVGACSEDGRGVERATRGSERGGEGGRVERGGGEMRGGLEEAEGVGCGGEHVASGSSPREDRASRRSGLKFHHSPTQKRTLQPKPVCVWCGVKVPQCPDARP
jgi:hypothetical protein